MIVNILTIYIRDNDCYGFDFIKINHKSLLSIHYDLFYKKISIELLFRILR